MQNQRIPFLVNKAERSPIAMARDILILQNFIKGKFIPLDYSIDSFDPSTGEVFAKVPDSGDKEVEDAVDAATEAFIGWSSKSIADRSKLLLRVADILESRLEEFARAESLDQGKPFWQAKAVDIPRAILNFRHFANTAQCDTDLAVSQLDQNVLNYTIRSPVGVAGIIVPWNLPLYLLTFKMAPALVYGNTIVAKPSEFTSVTAWMLCSVMQEAGIPPGVVNIIFGYGHKAGDALVKHPHVPLISFTGSTKTGTYIAEVTAKFAKKLSLEMGGKNAAIVFDDADLEKCVPALIRGSFLNQGQICLSTSRIYIQRPIFAIFVQKFVEEAKRLKIGNPSDRETWLGPVNSREHWMKVKSYLNLAKEEGATFLCGSHDFSLDHSNPKGYFVPATVLTDLADGSRCMQEEIFGPVTCLMPFDTEEEIVHRANGVKYGLCASVWAANVRRIHTIAPKLEVGTVWCNCWLLRNLHMPFGGMKMSGIGYEGTEDSKEFYTRKKTVCLKYD